MTMVWFLIGCKQRELKVKGERFCLGSVMHYGAYAFAVDPTIPTIITPNGEAIGQRVGFSDVCI